MGRATELDRTGAGLLTLEGEDLDSMMAVGKAPWHYAYNKSMVSLVAKDTKVTSRDINRVAGLDWEVAQVPLNDILKGDYRALPTDVVNVRTDKNLIVGKVKKRYRVFQNNQAPVFLDNLADSGDATYETAGSLHGGSQVWWLMKLPEGVTIGGDAREKLETYILFMNTHDGSTQAIVSIVTIRVVCQNTLTWALRDALRSFKIRHTDSANEQWAQARHALDIGYAYQAELAEWGGKMSEVSFSDGEFQAFLDDLVPTPKPVTITKQGKETVQNQRGITLANNTKGGITSIYYNNATQDHVRGSLWGAVQAVSYYTDHLGTSRNTEATGGASQEENRFKRLTSGATLSAEAFDKALALV